MNKFLNKVKENISYLHEEMSLEKYLEKAKTDSSLYATPHERLLKSIGEPELVDTKKDPKLGRIFQNKIIKIYPAFKEFYGMEETIERIVSFFKHAAQGLEESKQILYLLGPVGGGKSSLAERVKHLMEKYPIYVLGYKNEISPIFESPLGLFIEQGDELEREYNIPKRYLPACLSPWAIKRLQDSNGNLDDFKVIKLHPSVQRQIAISKTEPGDENNQDISTLVGKVDLRRLGEYAQSDPDAYSYSGGLCLSNQGVMEFVEMFKAPIKMLHPLLTATQEKNYKGTEPIGAIPFNGVIMAHCFSEDTEILTEHGWKGMNEINVGDIIATFNKQTEKIEYQPALNKYVYDDVKSMFHIKNSSADHLVTENHKMIYKSYENIKEVLVKDFFITGAELPVSGVCERPDMDIYENDEELRLHVWCVTDGSVAYTNKQNKLKYRWHLKKQRKIDRLTNLLNDLNIKYEIHDCNDGTFSIAADYIDSKFTKQFSEIHRKLSARQTTILLKEWAETDESKSNYHPERSFQLSTNVKFHSDLIQELATISGHKSTCAITEKEGHKDVYALWIKLNCSYVSSSKSTKNFANKGIVSYNGKVWCLETENHTLISRRNGKVLITGNSNESEWEVFSNDKKNEAFLDRVFIVRVPYVLRVDEEVKIYEKLINNSSLKDTVCAPKTLELLAEFSVLTRLKEPENSKLYSKLKIYNGENLKQTDPNAKALHEYKDQAGVNEGMDGISTRFAFKVLSRVFNFDIDEIAANPVHLFYILEDEIIKQQFDKELEETYIDFIKANLSSNYLDFLENELQKSYIDSYNEYGQNLFEKYLAYADYWIQDTDYRDPDTGQIFDRKMLNDFLEKIEKSADIANPKDFRNEMVNYVLRVKAKNKGEMPRWDSYEKIKSVIEKRIFSNTEDLLPIISFSAKSSKDEQKKHDAFVKRMIEKGYTEKQVKLLVDWFLRMNKNVQ